MKHKDINDMILVVTAKKDIQQIITDNTFKTAALQSKVRRMEKNKCSTIYPQHTKSLFTYHDIHVGYQKKKDEKRGMRQLLDISIFSQNTSKIQ